MSVTIPPGHHAREQANAACLKRLYAVRPTWSGVVTAQAALDLPALTLLHAGPPFRDPLCPSQPVLSSAVLCCLYEGWASSEAEAQTLLLKGHVRLVSAQDFNVVTPLAAVISPSTTLVEITDAQSSRRCWSLLSSGSGPQLRFGTRDGAVIKRLQWRDRRLAAVLEPLLPERPIDLFDLAYAGLLAGDDLHASTTTATCRLTALLAPRLGHAEDVHAMLEQSPLFFLTLWMGACHLMLDTASNDGENPEASLVVALSGNGQDVGVRLAGAPQRWLTKPACVPQGVRTSSGKACPMLGDSAVIDAAGFGAQAWFRAEKTAAGMAGWLPGGQSNTAAWHVGSHPLFKAFGLASAVDATAVTSTTRTPQVAIAMLDMNGRAGLLGRGLCTTPPALFTSTTEAGVAINASEPLTQLQHAFECYEAALTGNDLAVLDALFWHSAHTVRYGATEHLYGIEAIQAFRQSRRATGLQRRIVERSLTTFGVDFAVTNIVFQRPDHKRVGRQTQSWVRIEGQWRIVAAHVSWRDA